MVSFKFRQQLRQEIEKWQAEGLIDGKLHQQIARRYRLEELALEKQSRVIVMLLTLGSVLLTLAALTLVAATWQVWSRGLRASLLTGLFAIANVVGFYLWRFPRPRWQSGFGKGLLLLGALVLGANLALMSQMFPRSDASYPLYLVWSAGVLAMAGSLRLGLLAGMGIVLAGIGYWSGVFDLFNPGRHSPFLLAVQHMPILAAIAFVPIAIGCRSRWVFALAAIATITALETNSVIWLSRTDLPPRWWGALAGVAIVMPAMLLWPAKALRKDAFGQTSSAIALFYLAMTLFVFSFRGFWTDVTLFWYPGGLGRDGVATMNWMFLDLGILGLVALWGWWRLAGSAWLRWPQHLEDGLAAAASIATGIVCWLHLGTGTSSWLAAIAFNLLLLLLASSLIVRGLASRWRSYFWGGSLLLVAQLVARMLEYDTGLGLKATVLFVCGMGIIGVGLWFEHYLLVSSRDDAERSD